MAEIGQDLTNCVSAEIPTTKGDQGSSCAETRQHMSEFLKEEQNPVEQNDDLCQEHQWKLNLFCTEPGCETPICVQCLYDEHKSHNFGNIEEVIPRRCHSLLKDAGSLKERFQRYKDKLVTVQNKENVNFSTCINIIRKNEDELIRKIKMRTEKMVEIVLDEKARVSNSFKEAVAKIQDNFVLLESIEETTSEYTSHRSLTDKIKAVKKSGEQVSDALMKVQKYKYVLYQGCKAPNRKVKVLCGRLKRRWRKIPICKMKETDRKRASVKKETVNEPTEFCEQSREANQEASEESQVDVIEVSHDETSERSTVAKPVLQGKTKGIPDKDDATGTSSGDTIERNSRDTNKKRTTLNVGNSFGAQNSEIDDSAVKHFAKQPLM